MRVHHIALRCADIERTARYYTSVLELRERERKYRSDGGLRSIWLDAEGVVVMCEAREDSEPEVHPSSLELVAFSVSEGELDRLRAKMAPVEAETKFTLYARDPDGRRVAVSCYRFE
ncbi:MAG: VOC family protein [Polyangiales bacterium]